MRKVAMPAAMKNRMSTTTITTPPRERPPPSAWVGGGWISVKPPRLGGLAAPGRIDVAGSAPGPGRDRPDGAL